MRLIDKATKNDKKIFGCDKGRPSHSIRVEPRLKIAVNHTFVIQCTNETNFRRTLKWTYFEACIFINYLDQLTCSRQLRKGFISDWPILVSQNSMLMQYSFLVISYLTVVHHIILTTYCISFLVIQNGPFILSFCWKPSGCSRN